MANKQLFNVHEASDWNLAEPSPDQFLWEPYP
jgi:hypothetical protein